MLKANNSIQIATPLTKSESSPFSPEAQSKLSKLVSRKNKGTSDPPKAGAQANSLHTNISHVMNSVRDHLPAPPQHHPDSPPSTQQQHRTLFTTAAEHPSAKIASNTIAATDVASRGDLEALLKEKQQWLRTIHEDNGKMAKMLKVSHCYSGQLIYASLIEIDCICLMTGIARSKDQLGTENGRGRYRSEVAPPEFFSRRHRRSGRILEGRF